jgi:hypothetical protein
MSRQSHLPFGVKAIKAQVYKEKSWLDGKECIVLDYSKTSLVAKCIRDEIREVAPGLYLGQVFLGKKPTIHFTVSFSIPAGTKVLAPGGGGRRDRERAFRRLLCGAIAAGSARDLRSTEDHFKYGSTGGEREAGIPYWLWKTLPEMFAEYLRPED